jgi:hypothetical protein
VSKAKNVSDKKIHRIIKILNILDRGEIVYTNALADELASLIV